MNYVPKAGSFFRNLGYSLAFTAGFASGSYAQDEKKPEPKIEQQEKMPSIPDPKDWKFPPELQSPPKSLTQIIDEPVDALEAMQKVAEKLANQEHKPATPYVLERLTSCGCASKQEVHDDYCRFRAGMQTRDAGHLLRVDGKLTLGDQTSLSFDGVYQKPEGSEGAADYEKTEYSLMARLATGKLNLWANGAQMEKLLSRSSNSVSQPSPTLTQTTMRMEDSDLDKLHLAGKLDYLVTDNFMLRGKMYSITREDAILVAQQDRVQGTVIVPGFGSVPVDDLILTNVETATKSRERGGGFGFEWWLDKGISVMALPERQAYTESVKLNGSTIIEEDRVSWRLPARVQFAELVFHPEYRINDDDSLKDEWSGWAHYTAVFPSIVAANLAAGVGENHRNFKERQDRAYYAAMFAFRENGFNEKEAEIIRTYRDLTLDLVHDLTLTSEQRSRIARDAFEELVYGTNAFIVDVSRNHLDTRMLYAVKAGAPLADWLTVMGAVEGSRDYRAWSFGARLNFWGMRIGPDFTKSKDSLYDTDSLEALISVTIGK